MIDALADVSKEAISVAASALGARSKMVTMLSTGGVIGPLAGMVVGNLVGDMVGILGGVSTEFFMNIKLEFVVVMPWEYTVPSSYAKDGESSWLGIACCANASMLVRVDVRLDAFTDTLARVANDGVLTDTDANVSVAVLAVLEILILPTTLGELLL